MNNFFHFMMVLAFFCQPVALASYPQKCSLDAKRLYGLIKSSTLSVDEKIKGAKEILASPKAKLNEQELGYALLLISTASSPTFNLDFIKVIVGANTGYSSTVTIINSADENAYTVMDHVNAQCSRSQNDNRCIEIAAYLRSLGAHRQTAYGFAEHMRENAKSANLNACPH